MATQNSVKIPVSVELKAHANSTEQFISQLEKKISEANISDDLLKVSDQSINKMRKKLEGLQELLTFDALSFSENNQVKKYFRDIEKEYNLLGTKFQKAGYLNLGLESGVLKEIEEAYNKIKKIQDRKAKEFSSTSAGTYLSKENAALLAEAEEKYGSRFDKTKSISANLTELKKEQEEVQKLIETYGDLAEVQNKRQVSQNRLQELDKQIDAYNAVKSNKKAWTAYGRLVSAENFQQLSWANNASYKQRFGSLSKWINESFSTLGSAGDLTNVNNLAGKIFTEIMGLNQTEPIDKNQLNSWAAMSVEQLEQALEQQIKTLLEINRSGDKGVKEKLSKFFTEIISPEGTYQKQAKSYANNYGVIMSAKPAIDAAKVNIKELEAQREKEKTNDEYLSTVESRIQNAQNSLVKVIEGLSMALSKLRDELDKKYEKELEDAQEEAQGLVAKETQKRSSQLGLYSENTPFGLGKDYAEKSSAAYQAKAEAEAFKANLQTSIKHWMGAQQVITYIKQGIRQAYQDIQGLDKAMTNIAVVTDFSVSDLWGKINEYMAIAQQYGVTTQGVYEVSQLYFQQGLSESDTMAATTETLKMARIAGMDYAEAADGMTVAIRGFNMEMQDAARVTDVYSKVAAITASDTQELVTAMSKTASSAAAVGSSFENTAAMLAVMIEATRESPQNLGSALKSIISRYGEMTKGLTEDSEGEEIDYNRVDTALKTIGITLKDAQGQFRDFDDVILELSKKWDTLDSVTQRYIATIFAGNRQQSRFLALVSNVERYIEVSEAAANSEDAGLLQYSKTLDSLETKINNIKTSFQQFYMSLINGDNIKGALDFINNLIKGLNKLSKFTTILNFGSIIISVKTIGNLIVNGFTSGMSQIQTNWRTMMKELVEIARRGGEEAGQAHAQGCQNGQRGVTTTSQTFTTKQKAWLNGGLMAGGLLSAAGSALASTHQTGGAILSGFGNAISYGTQAGLMAASIPGLQAAALPIGIATAAITGLVSAISSIPSAVENAQQKLEQAQQEAEKANIKRAEAREKASSLESIIKQLKELEKAQYDSEEAQKAYIDASNAAFEKFPELTAVFDEAGNAIIDASNAEQLLASARMAAAQATINAAVAENKQAKAKQTKLNAELLQSRSNEGALGKLLSYSDKGYTFKGMSGQGVVRTKSDYEQIVGGRQANFGTLLLELLGISSNTASEAGLNRQYLDTLSLEEVIVAFDKAQKQEKLKVKQSDYEEIIENVLSSAREITSDESYNDYLKKANYNIQQSQANYLALRSTEKAIAIAEINDYFTLQDIGQYKGKGIDWQTKIEGATEQFQQIILDSIDYSKIEYDKEGEIILSTLTDQLNLDTLFSQYTELYNQLYQSFQLDEYNELIKNATSGKISISEYTNQLIEIFGNNIPEIVSKRFLDWKEEADKAADNLRTSLSTEREVGWDSLEKEISLIPETFYDEIASFANKIDDLIKGQAITSKQGQAIAESYSNLWNLIYTDIDKNLQGIAYNLLANADLTSIGGVIEFQNSLEEEGIILKDFDFSSLISNLSVNVITEYQNLQAKLASGLDATAKALGDASSGITSIEDAIKMANKLGVSLGEFRVEDNKFYFDDTNKLQEAYGKDLSNYSEQLSKTLDKYIQQSSGLSDIDWDSSESLEKKTEFLKNRINQLSEEENLDEFGQAELESLIIQRDTLNQFSSGYKKYLADGGKGTLTDYLIKYREIEMEAFDEANKQWMDQLIADINYDNEVRNLTTKYAGDKYSQKRQDALDKLVSTGGIGLSGSELAQLEADYFGLDESGKVKGTFGATRQADGTWKISQTKMAELSVRASNSASSIINETVAQTQEGLDALGEAVAFKKQLDISEKRDLLGEYAQNFTDEQINFVWSLYEQALISENGIAALESSLTNIFMSQGKDSTTAARMAKESIDSLNDNVEENIQNILDLKLSLLEGSITNIERTILEGQDESFLTAYDAAISASASERASKIFSLYEQVYTEQLIAGDITASEALENTAKAASQQLDEWLGLSLIQFNKEATQGIEEGDLTQTADEFGQLFVSTRKNAKETLESFYNTYSKGITDSGEIILDVQKLKADNRISEKEYVKFQRNFAKETFGSAEDLITRMASKDDVYADEIENFFETLGAPLQEGEAELLLQSGVQTFLSKIESTLLATGVPQSDIDSRLAEIQSQLVDLLLESISTGISSLGSGLEGTLGAADYQNLAKKYDLTGIGTTRSSKGIRLGAADQQKLISKMFLEAQDAGLSAEFGDQLWEVWRDSTEDAIDGYTAIEKEIAKAKDGQAELTGETKAYVEALQQARAAAMFDENAVEFAFMEQDSVNGLTKNFDKFVDGIDKAKDAISGLKTSKTMGYNDFFNILDTISKSGNWETVAKNMGLAQEFVDDYNHFATSVVSASEEIGKIDAKGLAKVGLDVSTAAKGMAEGMADGLKETAKSQIKYLSGLEQMLLALQALEGIGDISLDLGISFESSIDGPIDLTLANISKYWQEIMNLGDANLNAEINVSINNKLKELGAAGFNDFFKNLGFGENFDFITAFFGPDGFTFGSQTETQLASQLGQFTSLTKNLTENQWITLAQDMQSIFKSRMKFDPKTGLFSGFELGEGGLEALIADINKFLANYNFSDIKESLNTALRQKMGSEMKGEIALETSGFKLKLNGENFEIENLTAEDLLKPEIKNALIQDLTDYLGQTVTDIKLNKEDGTVDIFGENGLINTEGMKKINTDFQTAAAAASTLETAITNISTVASTFQASSGFQQLAQNLNAAATAAQALNKALNGDIETPDTSFIESQLAGAEQTLALLQMSGASPEIIAEAQTQVTALQTQLNSLTVPVGTTVGLVGELTTAIDVANKLSEALSNNNGTPLEVNFNADDANGQVTTLITNLLQLNDVFIPTITVDMAQAQSDIAEFLMSYVEVVETSDPVVEVSAVTESAATQLQDIINKLSAIESKEVTIKVKTIYETIGSSGGLTDGGTTKAWTGTVNNITGSSFANGNVSALNAEAKLANKTLVGELGPELAVYNGQYHLLGQTGAEFVKLPNDALIFNHLQTEGIISGQMKNARAKAFKGRADSAIAKAMGSAMATGNIAGPAFASGIAGALSAVRRAKSVWQGLLNSLSAADLMGAGGGGGGGGDNNLKAHIEDLQEWYNLSRQIAKIEQEINTLLAKRKNITDGHEYLKNLRETQKLLTQQVATQQVLIKYQQQQLEAQAEHINNNKIWSQFLTVGEDGLLQYKEGNETNGGKGSLSVLQQMNEMSGEEQVAFLAKLGYSYTDNDGNTLEGEELVAKFFEELQKQIDDYDALADTVAEAEKALADLESEIVEIEKEIRNNEIDLSKQIYDIIVDAWEENIKNLKEQNELIKEANEAYADGIQEAIDAERQMYEQNQAISDREQLQRQLALLRRSGGSASEIADLEAQLDDMLKDEYFANQEEALETIRDANERQVELMDQQVKIQEEQLEYQKENGIIWMKVYEIMEGTDAEILDFMQGNSTTFFQQSTLQQEDMLTEWAKKIGIYTEERQRYNYNREIGVNDFTSSLVSEDGKTDYTSIYNKLKDTEKDTLKNLFEKTYTNARLDGKSGAEALKLANEAVQKFLKDWKKAWDAASKQSSNSGGSSSVGSSSNVNNSSGSSDSSSKNTNYYYIKVGDDFVGVNSSGSKSSIISYIAKKSGKTEEEVKKQLKTSKHYATGGLINYTGPAWVDGSKSKPERILSAEQNKILEEGLAMAAGRGETLKEAFSSFASSLGSSVREAVSNITKNTDNSNFTIASGAVQLQIAQLNDKYDVDELFNDVTDKIYSIAARASGRSVSRR